MTAIAFPPANTSSGNMPGDGPLRLGGQLASEVPAVEDNLPSKPSEAVKKRAADLAMCRDLDAGPRRVRNGATQYLPQAPGEDPADYAVRLARSVFYNVFAHTKEGLVGQVFRKDPMLGDDVPEVIKAHCENIDLAGTHFDVFAKKRLADALVAGHCAIFIEYPQTGGRQGRATELGTAAPIRPYWLPITKDQILSWRTATIDGREVLTQVVLKECTMVPAGNFGDKEQVRYRVFFRTDAGEVGFVLLAITDDKKVVIVGEGLYPTQDEIPIAEIPTSGSTGLLESDPPLLDLAFLNIAHYQQYSDYTTSIYKTCCPILTMTGFEEPEGKARVVVGPNAVLRNSNPQAKVSYTSHDGAALASCKQALDDLKSDMGTLGLAMLSPQKRTAETAQAKRLDKSTEDSALATTARGLQDGLERALYFHARYLRQDAGGSVKVNKQFDAQQMDAALFSSWTQAVATAGIPPRLMVNAMQEGELISPDENADAIADEMAANAKAAADQAAIDAQAAADAMAKAKGAA